MIGRIRGLPGLVEGVQGIAGEVRNLVMKANAGTPITKLDVSFDDCLVATPEGKVRSIGAQSLTANYAVNGLNGLDSGTGAGASWYYVWAVWNEFQAALLLSLSNTNPQMPAGYTMKGLVGESQYDGTTALRGFILYFPGRKEFRLTGTGGLPAVDTPAGFTHRLGVLPGMVQLRLVCATAEFNYAVGDEIPTEYVLNDAVNGTAFHVMADGVTVTVLLAGAYTTANVRTLNKTTFVIVTLTKANWNWKVLAST